MKRSKTLNDVNKKLFLDASSSLSSLAKIADDFGYRLKFILIPQKNPGVKIKTGLKSKKLDKESGVYCLDLLIKNHDDPDKWLAIFFIDLDGFKSVNDRYGHLVGDEVIAKIIEQAKTVIRNQDLFFRYGGDEFILIAKINAANAHVNAIKIYQRLLKVFSSSKKIQRNLKITASTGVSFYPKDAKDSKTLLHYADLAMYAAKKSGANKICFYMK